MQRNRDYVFCGICVLEIKLEMITIVLLPVMKSSSVTFFTFLVKPTLYIKRHTLKMLIPNNKIPKEKVHVYTHLGSFESPYPNLAILL